ncbi:MAG: 4'-phosphopantetheinyl transferase superfamily protein [Bacteroidales bacterium]|nr:4'-phosphopantetheinyl transferase superfamily protein [Bacteroidales bacterium]
MLEIKFIKCHETAFYHNNKSLFFSLLSDSEIIELENFKNQKHQSEHACGLAITRKLLADHLSITPKEIILDFEKHGKPFCKNDTQLFFNISHGGEFVAIAVADVPVGIDVETWQRKVPMTIASRYFSTEEQNALNAVDGDEQKQLFFRLWTAKESYLKMLGTGLTRSLSSFSIDFQQKEPRIFDENQQNAAAFLWHFQPDFWHIMCVCRPILSPQINCQTITFDEIFN